MCWAKAKSYGASVAAWFARRLPAPGDRIVLVWIVAMALLGVALGGALLGFYTLACAGRQHGVCKMVADSPPWFLLTGVVAAPAVLLTWYWRTVHKRADIEKGRDDLAHASAVLKTDKKRARREHSLATEAQFTDRFARAIELLGSERLPVRLGAIYALERLARDSVVDRSVIIETLAAFVRLSCTYDPMMVDPESMSRDAPAEDDLAALKVLGRRGEDGEPTINLEETNLYGVRLNGASFNYARLAGAYMVNARLDNASFHGANLYGVDLALAFLRGAQFPGAILVKGNLVRASLTRANLGSAKLKGAMLAEADFSDANLTEADLEEANLTNSVLMGADLRGTFWKGATVLKATIEQGTLGGTQITLSEDEFQALLAGERRL